MSDYIFRSERLGFRNWQESDIIPMAAINADPEVMRYFPAIQTTSQTQDFIQKMQLQFQERGYCYFAVELLKTNTLIGFTGLSDKTFESDFTPCIDIGWRLGTAHWNKGYATEGAARCLQYGFESLKINTINAIAPKINVPSIAVMEKIRMKKVKEFQHPLLINDDWLQPCVLYEIRNSG